MMQLVHTRRSGGIGQLSKTFQVFYQLQFDLITRRPFAAEALLRVSGNNGKNCAPLGLIHAAEQNGTMINLTFGVIEQVLSDFQEIQEALGLQSIAVNVSPGDLINAEFVPRLSELLKKYGVKGHQLELEITEHMPIVKLDKTIATLNQLNDLGITVMLDDFGTGFASLQSLIGLPITGIKLDKVFCVNAADYKYRNVAEALIQLSDRLNLESLVEGIESEALFREYLSMGARKGQGYLLHKPEPKGSLLNFHSFLNARHSIFHAYGL